MTKENKALKVLARPEVVEVIKEVDELLGATSLAQAIAYQAQSFMVEAFDEGLGSLISTVMGSVTEEAIELARNNIFSVIQPKLESKEMRAALRKAIYKVLVRFNLEQIKNEAYELALKSIPELEKKNEEVLANYKRKELKTVIRDDLDNLNAIVYQVLRSFTKTTSVITQFDEKSFTLNDSIKLFFELRLPNEEQKKELGITDEMILVLKEELPNGLKRCLHVFVLKSEIELVEILTFVIQDILS